MRQHSGAARLAVALVLLVASGPLRPLLAASGPDEASSVFLYGESPTAHEAHAGTPWTYDAAGEDWAAGVDGAGKPWVCASGKQQSPVNLLTSAPVATPLADEHRAVFALGAAASNGSNVAVANNGHSVQVSWAGQQGFAPKVTVAIQDGQLLVSAVALKASDKVQQVTAVPRQFHFHAHSEHLVAGHLYPLEAHLVSTISRASLASCPPEGCIMVTGVMFELADDIAADNPWLEPLFQAMPLSEGEVSHLPAGASLDLQALLPANTSYVSYAGSLTTPPCTEGVLWGVMLNTQKLSLAQWRRFMTAVGEYNCTADATNGAATSSNATKAAGSGRRLLGQQQQQQQTPQGEQRLGRQVQQQQQSQKGAAQHLVCHKLGAGANYRLPQPLNGRVLRVWRQQDGRKGSYLPDDAASAASAGAVAGIVLGTTLGAGLTALIGWVAWREYQKRRLKRFYKYGVSSGDMLSVHREVETQWLSANGSSANGSGPARPL